MAALTKTSRMIRRMARNAGMMDPAVGTQPEILDDLVDGWAATVHTGTAGYACRCGGWGVFLVGEGARAVASTAAAKGKQGQRGRE